ncbi:MAG: hypothetical protein DLM53_07550 [Candidatus Eremiobacter antarcticus]|nr:hypothetical protein [Candidatus Eremiobacteraeota bacterium]MBC5807229.1 hypothetical protein [Candidatus Eremiobacteraeota bacterium]PZR61910.1 MAG: hypothetical protein DLM53_07550 [Candidatus Eremiobacter sp. RRmetagenome_bin22]
MKKDYGMLGTLLLTLVAFCVLVLLGIVLYRCYTEWKQAERDKRQAQLLPAATSAVRYALSSQFLRDVKNYLKG